MTSVTAQRAPLPADTGQTADPSGTMERTAQQLTSLWHNGAEWVSLHGAELLIGAMAGTLIYLLLRVVRRFVRQRAARQGGTGTIGALALHTLARTKHFFLVMAALRLVIGYVAAPALIDQTVRFLFIVAAALQAAIWGKELVMGLVRQRASVEGSETLGNALSLINVLVTVALFLLAGIMVLDNVGVNVTGLVAGLGIGGIAIGLAAKGVFEDLFAALAIIFDRPFRKGDTVRFAGHTGTVERVGLKSTRLRAVTGEELVVSNTQLLNQEIANLTRLASRRMTLLFGTTYETPAGQQRRVPELAEAVVATAGAQLVRCGITALGASSVDYELVFDVQSPDYATAFAARHSIALGLIERFASESVAIAYPTQVSYSAAPDGTLVMPYANEPVPERPARA